MWRAALCHTGSEKHANHTTDARQTFRDWLEALQSTSCDSVVPSKLAHVQSSRFKCTQHWYGGSWVQDRNVTCFLCHTILECCDVKW